MNSDSTPLLFSICSLLMSGLIGPAVVVLFTYHMRRRERADAKRLFEREEVHRREVAEEARRVVREMIAQNEQLTRKTRDEIIRVAGRTVDTVKAMANGNLLEAERRELEASRLALENMREVVAMKERRGERALPETYVAIDRLEAQIRALQADIRTKEQLKYSDEDWQ